jgi:hypothetical protein
VIIGILAALLVVGGGGTAWYLLATSQAVGGSPSAAPGPVPASVPRPGADSGGDVSVDVEVGECIAAAGTITAATAEPVACGSPEANYKVIAKAETAADCPSDVNSAFFETVGGRQVGALCLDVDWVEGDCYELSGEDPRRVSCIAPEFETVRAGETVLGTADASVCPGGGGFSYPERRFVVCAQQVSIGDLIPDIDIPG